MEWTSLRGHDRKKLLEKLPEIIPNKLLQGQKGEDIKRLWMVQHCTCKNNKMYIQY